MVQSCSGGYDIISIQPVPTSGGLPTAILADGDRIGSYSPANAASLMKWVHRSKLIFNIGEDWHFIP